MALYLSVVIGALVVGFDDESHDQVRLVWGTGISLGLAHILAFRLSVTFVRERGRPTREDAWATLVVAVAVVGVCSVVSVPLLIWGRNGSAASTLAQAVLLGIVAATAIGSELRAGATWPRAVAFAMASMAGAVALVILKDALTH